MPNDICAYCMLHRFNSFKELIDNIKKNTGLYDIKFYAFSFQDSFGKTTKNKLEENISNLKIEYVKKLIPKFIKKKDLFYNKKHLNYVKTSFPKSRINYCHMCNFVSEPSKIPYINNFEITIQFDDDIWFLKQLNFDLNLFKEDPIKKIVTSHTHIDDILKRRETKLGFFEATRDYCKKKGIIPKFKLLADAIEQNNIELFHKLPWTSCSFNIYKMSIFQTKEWEDWINYIKSTGGIFTNRWGDQEIIGTYAYMYFENPILNLDLKDDQFINKRSNEAIIYFEKNLLKLLLNKFKKVCKESIKKYF